MRGKMTSGLHPDGSSPEKRGELWGVSVRMLLATVNTKLTWPAISGRGGFRISQTSLWWLIRKIKGTMEANSSPSHSLAGQLGPGLACSGGWGLPHLQTLCGQKKKRAASPSHLIGRTREASQWLTLMLYWPRWSPHAQAEPITGKDSRPRGSLGQSGFTPETCGGA